MLAADNGFSLLTKVMFPWYWSEIQLTVQDSVALNAGFYTECDVNKFFLTMSALATSEGLSEMGARFGGSYMFQYKEYKKVKELPGATGFQKGEAFGNLFAAVADYHI